MDKLKENVSLVLMLLPGFLSLGVATYVSTIGEIPDIQYVVLALALTYLNVMITSLVWHKRLGVQLPSPDADRWRLRFFMMLFGVSIITGLGFGSLYESDLAFRLVRSLFGQSAFIKETSQPQLQAILRRLNHGPYPNDKRPPGMQYAGTWVRINITKDDPPVEGFPASWSSRAQSTQVFLSPACNMAGGKAQLVQGPGILVTSDKIASITLIDEDHSACWSEYSAAVAKLPHQSPSQQQPGAIKDMVTVLATILLGALGWFVTHFFLAPLRRLEALRCRAQEEMIFTGNIDDTAPGEEREKAAEVLRRTGSRLVAVGQTAPPWVRWWNRARGIDPQGAGECLIGLSTSLWPGDSLLRRATARDAVEHALRLPQTYSASDLAALARNDTG
jgi:hypothetical protein